MKLERQHDGKGHEGGRSGRTRCARHRLPPLCEVGQAFWSGCAVELHVELVVVARLLCSRRAFGRHAARGTQLGVFWFKTLSSRNVMVGGRAERGGGLGRWC